MAEIQDININRVEVKLADTDDPLASKIDWSPAASGGANFRTQKLDKDSSSRLLIKATIGAQLFSFVFMLPGLAGLVAGAPYHFFVTGDLGTGFFFIAWGGIFFGAGFLMWRHFSRGYVFDKRAGRYFKGKQAESSRAPSDENQGRLQDIHALQMLTERVTSNSKNGGSSSYNSYEINLVLKNGARLNVMDHGNKTDIEDNAKEIAVFLGVPIWRASYGKCQ